MHLTHILHKSLMTSLLFCLILFGSRTAAQSNKTIELQVPQHVWVEYSEKNLVVNWDSVAGAIGYNVYRSSKKSDEKEDMELLNRKMITSAPRFVFIWRFDQGQRERSIKGHQHFIAVTAVYNIDGDTCESALSARVSNKYFDGFSNVISKRRIENILQEEQKSEPLPVSVIPNSKGDFIAFMTGPGRYLTKVLRDSLDFLEVGACEPVSTIALKLLSKWGLHAFKAEGLFIEEFHTFLVINLEDVEYILDFTADQFVPNVAPVMVPRDLCFINREGKLDTTGTAIYQIGKLFSTESSQLNETKATRIYQSIYRNVFDAYIN
jgi:hypothetical protein